MSLLVSIVWDMNPEIFPSLFSSLPIHPRWYGILFAIAFLLGLKIEEQIFEKEKRDRSLVDSLFVTALIGIIVGARLGHVFFYGWDYYSQNLGDIIKIWEGGLASHGAAIGIIAALYFWSKYTAKVSLLWTLDRVVIAMASGGALVRLGNFFNSEIVGRPTELPWGVNFVQLGDNIARHPAQLYESIAYLITFIILYRGYWKGGRGKQTGFLFGMFLVLVFGFRFIVEFVKENQEVFENDMVLNMGQWLSIPAVLIGVFFIWKSQTKASTQS